MKTDFPPEPCNPAGTCKHDPAQRVALARPTPAGDARRRMLARRIRTAKQALSIRPGEEIHGITIAGLRLLFVGGPYIRRRLKHPSFCVHRGGFP